MRQFEPQPDGPQECRVPEHPADCDCGTDPDLIYEREADRRAEEVSH